MDTKLVETFGGLPIHPSESVKVGQVVYAPPGSFGLSREFSGGVFMHPFDVLEVKYGHDFDARLEGTLELLVQKIEYQARQACNRIDRMYS